VSSAIRLCRERGVREFVAQSHKVRRSGAPLTEIAAALRGVGELRPGLAELRELLDELTARAKKFRASWLAVADTAR
jgi:hypothetical protein